MVSEETLALANSYLEKHRVTDAIVGLGPILDSGNIELFAGHSVMLDGSLAIEFNSRYYVDCRSIAQKLYLDILKNNPELNPRIVMQKGQLQNWVEITDSKSGETVQIDSTPWYGCLNHGLVGDVNNQVGDITFLDIKKTTGPIISVKKTESGPITVFFVGFLPRISIKDKIARMKTRDHDIEDKLPEYSFVVQAEFKRGFVVAKPEKWITVTVDVLDTSKLNEFTSLGVDLDTLIAANVIRFSLDIGGVGIPHPSVSLMKVMATAINLDNLFVEIERNIPRVMVLLKKLKPVLSFHSDPKREVDVKTGMSVVSMANRYSISGGLRPKDFSKGSEFTRRYEEFIRGSRKTSEITIPCRPIKLTEK
ncbi:MAG: hypothetical protein Q7S22_01355 [Candidatus Micrarchaeota archaeon]|nr:hypothetical protein [Candidatus Micrarchaeota archaeon]